MLVPFSNFRFSSTAVENVLGGDGNCPGQGGRVRGADMSEEEMKCPGEMPYTHGDKSDALAVTRYLSIQYYTTSHRCV